MKRMVMHIVVLAVILLLAASATTIALARPNDKVSGEGNIYGNEFKFTAMGDNGIFKGNLNYKTNDINLQSIKITDLNINSDTSAQIEGTATVNGNEGYTFFVFVADNGEPGVNDVFYIEIYGPGPTVYKGGNPSGGIDSGNINIKK